MIVQDEETFAVEDVRAARNVLRLRCDDCGATSNFCVLADVGVTGERLREYVMVDRGGTSWRVYDGADVCPFCRLLRDPVTPETEEIVARARAAKRRNRESRTCDGTGEILCRCGSRLYPGSTCVCGPKECPGCPECRGHRDSAATA